MEFDSNKLTQLFLTIFSSAITATRTLQTLDTTIFCIIFLNKLKIVSFHRVLKRIITKLKNNNNNNNSLADNNNKNI